MQIDTQKSLQDRFMLNVQFQIMGRPYELGYIKFESLSYCPVTEMLYVEAWRTKVARYHKHAVSSTPIGQKFVDHHSDIYHAMGTAFMLGFYDALRDHPIFKILGLLKSRPQKRAGTKQKGSSSTSCFTSYIKAMFDKLVSGANFSGSSVRGSAAR
jgi:hypothetical protein